MGLLISYLSGDRLVESSIGHDHLAGGGKSFSHRDYIPNKMVKAVPAMGPLLDDELRPFDG